MLIGVEHSLLFGLFCSPGMEPLILGTNGFVVAIDPANGSVLWQTKLAEGFFSATSNSDVAVLVRAGMVFAGSAGHLFCIDAQSGKILWHNPLKGLGNNDVSLAIEGVSVQYLEKVERRSS